MPGVVAEHDAGFRRCEAVPHSVLERLRQTFDPLGAEHEPYFSSNVHCTRQVAMAVDEELKRLLGGLVTELIGEDVEPFLAAFISKSGRSGSRVAFHQDWTYTDEREHRVTIAWIPLVDTTVTNGALSFVRGSHRWTDGVRSDTPEAPTAGLQDRLSRMATMVPAAAGQVILYDPAIVHGSSPNITSRTRPAAAIAFKPVDAPLIHCHQPTTGPLEAFIVDSVWYTSQPYRQRPEGYERIEPWSDPVQAEDLDAHLPPTPVPDRGPARSRWPATRDRALRPGDLRPALRDRSLDAALRRDGFVGLPLLDHDEVAGLRSAFERLHGWEGDGVSPDLEIAEPSYRRAVRREIGTALDERVRALFLDHRPFRWDFACRFPGAGSELPLQRDWTYVDERLGGSTFVVWVALDDVTGHNGQLRVLRGSHLVDRTLRGTDLTAGWMRHESFMRARLESVPVRAGECVVMDHALVHCSYPNHTDAPRLVAAVGVRPSEEPLTYVRRRDAHHAERYAVDEDFFCDHSPAELGATAPQLPVVELLELAPTDLTEPELRRRLPTTARGPFARRLARAGSWSGHLIRPTRRST